MQVSAEIRWFWPAEPPIGLVPWFNSVEVHSCQPGGGKVREDAYLRDPNQLELGIKRRGSKRGIEVKGLVAVITAGLNASPFVGPIELWTKWTSEALELPSLSTILTKKRRWLRKFDTTGAVPAEIPLNEDELPLDQRALPALGCNVELTRIEVLSNEFWWTLGFESFGAIQTVESQLRAVANTLAAKSPPSLGDGWLASYPSWLKQSVRA